MAIPRSFFFVTVAKSAYIRPAVHALTAVRRRLRPPPPLCLRRPDRAVRQSRRAVSSCPQLLAKGVSSNFMPKIKFFNDVLRLDMEGVSGILLRYPQVAHGAFLVLERPGDSPRCRCSCCCCCCCVGFVVAMLSVIVVLIIFDVEFLRVLLAVEADTASASVVALFVALPEVPSRLCSACFLVVWLSADYYIPMPVFGAKRSTALCGTSSSRSP